MSIPSLGNTLKADLDALEADLAKMSPGPWKTCGASDNRCPCHRVWSTPADIPVLHTFTANDDEDGPTHDNAADNAIALVALYNAAPSLIVELRRLRALENSFREGLVTLDAVIDSEADSDPWDDGANARIERAFHEFYKSVRRELKAENG